MNEIRILREPEDMVVIPRQRLTLKTREVCSLCSSQPSDERKSLEDKTSCLQQAVVGGRLNSATTERN